MKQGFFTSAVAVVLMLGVNSYATNGVQVIGISPASQGMGGTGVSHYFTGADAMYKNPALLSDSSLNDGSFAAEFYGTFTKQNSTGDFGTGAVDAAGGSRFAPNLSVSYRYNKQLDLGLAILGYGGGNLDYAGQSAIFQPKSELTLVKILPTASYRLSDQFSIGVSPVIGYGEFALNESLSSGTGVPGTDQTTRFPHGSMGFGVEVGVVGKFIPDVTFGASFITKSGYNYKQLSDLEQFSATTIGTPATLDDVKLQQPAEFSFGMTYKPCECLVLSFDYRFIGWGGADGYKDFNWINQNVFAFGAQYQYLSWFLRGGVNYAKSPIEDSSGETGNTDFQGHTIMNQAISLLDMFPLAATTSTHVTVGTGYEFTKAFSADVSFVYAPKVSVTRGGTSPLTSAAYSYTSTSQQWAIGFGGTYKF